LVALAPSCSLRSLPLCSPCVIVPSLASIEVVGSYHPHTIAALRQDHSNLAARVGFAVIHESEFSLNLLLIDGNWIVQECLLRLFTFNLMSPNFAEVVPIPFEHR